MKFFCLFAFVFVLLLPLEAHALPDSARSSYNHLNQCVIDKNLAGCRDDITASSIPLYDRFTSYGLADCLPKDATFVSETPLGMYHVIRASTQSKDQQRIMRLAFVNEEDRWKLDVPESLHIAMGDNWQKQIDATEQIYLLLRQQLGPQLNCSMIRGLVQKQDKPSH